MPPPPIPEGRQRWRPVRPTADRDPYPRAADTDVRNPGSPPDAETYFLVLEQVSRMFERDRAAQLPDVDAVTDIALRRVEAGRASVVSEDRYNAWVAVVCRNAYLNFIRSRRDRRTIPDFDSIRDPRTTSDSTYDARIVREAILAAIERLPPFLRDVAHLRFVEDWSHGAIAERTGKTLPITRAYANKAANRLRSDGRLRRIMRELRV